MQTHCDRGHWLPQLYDETVRVFVTLYWGEFVQPLLLWKSTVCRTRYRTRHFFNNFTVSQQLGALQTHYRHILLFKFRCNIFIGVRIIKEMPGSVASGTHCSNYYIFWVCVCSLSYPACNAHAPYWYLWPARLYRIFPHYLINGDFRKISHWT